MSKYSHQPYNKLNNAGLGCQSQGATATGNICCDSLTFKEKLFSEYTLTQIQGFLISSKKELSGEIPKGVAGGAGEFHYPFGRKKPSGDEYSLLKVQLRNLQRSG